MGKKKTSSNDVQKSDIKQPISVSAPFGGATYSKKKNQYIMGSDQEGQSLANLNSAQQGFGNALSRVSNPQSGIDQATSTYRNAMVPQFEQTMAEQLGKSVSGLGQRYQGTFGQLTLADQAQHAAVQRAGLEKTIYDSGQDAYARMLDQAIKQAGLTSSAQSIRLQPYELLGNLVSQGGSNVTGYNSAMTGLASSQANSGPDPTMQMIQMIAQMGGDAAKAAAAAA